VGPLDRIGERADRCVTELVVARGCSRGLCVGDVVGESHFECSFFMQSGHHSAHDGALLAQMWWAFFSASKKANFVMASQLEHGFSFVVA
jgi:hypothetical protein